MVNIPNNLEAEESVIGSILIDSDCFKLVSYIVSPDDFYDECNKVIFQSAVNLYSRRERINQVTIGQELERQGKLESCGGAAYLSHVISVTPSSMDAEFYAEIVRRLSVNRKLLYLAQKIQDEAIKENPDTNETIDKVTKLVSDFRKDNLTIDDLVSPVKLADEIFSMVNDYSNHDSERVIKWGFRDLDNLTGGIFPELTIIGARPSVGKTELMVNLVDNLKHRKVLFVSAEMSIRGLLERYVAKKLKKSIVDIRKGNISEDDLDGITMLSGEMSELSLYHLPPGKTSSEIYQYVDRLKETVGVDVVFVDYLQILKDCWSSKNDSMRIKVGQACKTLKGIVNDFNVPVICASQLNRSSEYRADDKPKLSDLRESGDIEQDADNVLLLWRDKENDPSILEVKIAKGRQTGDFTHVKLVWLDKERRYVDYYGGQ